LGQYSKVFTELTTTGSLDGDVQQFETTASEQSDPAVKMMFLIRAYELWVLLQNETEYTRVLGQMNALLPSCGEDQAAFQGYITKYEEALQE